MAQVRVERGEVGTVARPMQQDQPMRWAEYKSTGAVIYVGWLRADQNGNACGCKCPACGDELQAVNAGKDASHFLKANARGMFFRHPSGHQRKDCSFLAAKLAALHLLMKSGEVDLPPPRRTKMHEGASGTTYIGETVGRALYGRITSKVWVDNQSARITIDGRTILVQLQARPNFSSDFSLDGVITIRVNDPIVASWEPSQILLALKLDSEFSCWEKHWDDDELEAGAERNALAAADDALDRIPSELGLLNGLTNLQKSETVLHAKVKEILSRAGRLKVPYCDQEVTREMHDGSYKRRRVHIDSQNLILSQVRMEAPMQGLIPDVVCIAQSSRNPSNSFKLLIEVAVTHRVDASKSALIATRKLACVEIDLTRMGTRERRITVDQLESAVIDDVQGKCWIFNPTLARMVESNELELEREDRKLRAARQHEQERKQWLDNCSTERLIGLLLPTLEVHWLTDAALRVDDKYEVLPHDIAIRLTARNFKDANDPLLLANDGVLSCIEAIRNRRLSMTRAGRRAGIWRLDEEPTLQKYVTLGLMAARAYPSELTSEDMQKVNDLRVKVKDSLDSEESRYARPATHDKIIGTLYPAMRESLSKPFGTLRALQSKIEARNAKERKAAAETARIEEEKAAEVRREVKLIQEKIRAMQEKEFQQREKINDLLSRERSDSWHGDASSTAIGSVLKRIGVIRLIGNYARSGMDVEAILRSAWNSRARGHSFRSWFNEQSVKDTATAKMMLQALRAAGMVS
jgi:uncharacterized protein YaiL (DUF2058 family)